MMDRRSVGGQSCERIAVFLSVKCQHRRYDILDCDTPFGARGISGQIGDGIYQNHVVSVLFFLGRDFLR